MMEKRLGTSTGNKSTSINLGSGQIRVIINSRSLIFGGVRGRIRENILNRQTFEGLTIECIKREMDDGIIPPLIKKIGNPPLVNMRGQVRCDNCGIIVTRGWDSGRQHVRRHPLGCPA